MATADPRDGPARSRPFARLPGFHTLWGRYAYLMGIFAAFLLGAALFVHWRVEITTTHGIADTKTRQEAQVVLRKLRDNLWLAENALQSFLVVPRAERKRQALGILEEAQDNAAALSELAWVRRTPRAGDRIETLRARLDQLEAGARNLMAIREDEERLFPASPILQTRLRPADRRFTRAAADTLQDVRLLDGEAGQPERTDWLFAQALHTWSQRIGAFRIFIANRFGIFGDPEEGMAAQAYNVKLYGQKLERHLDRLERLNEQGELGLGEAAALHQMERAKSAWDKAYREAREIYTSQGWRRDLPLLRERVRPRFLESWGLLDAIGTQVETSTRDSVGVLAGTAERIKWVVWGVALAGLAVITFIFFFVEETIRKPVTRIARALQAEGLGHGTEPTPPGKLRETRDLAQAFDRMREQVHSRQQRLEAILDHAAEGVATFDREGLLHSFNPAAEGLFGYGETEITGQPLETILAADPAHPGEDRMLDRVIRECTDQECEMTGRHRDGREFPVALKASPMRVAGRKLYTVLVEDISERKAMFERLQEMAEHDGLTGLYNRTYFQTELERVVERTARNGQPATVLYLDLDNFKYINDTLGHAAGDRLLKEAADTMARRLRHSDLLARFGGDEYTVLLYDAGAEEARKVAEDIRRLLTERPFLAGSQEIDVTCSMGLAVIEPDSESAEEVLAQADFACHLAKRGGRNRFHLFQPEDQANVSSLSHDISWARSINTALDEDRLVLARQPVVDTAGGDVVKHELLVRMLDGDGELLYPGGFLPPAERFGLAPAIDQWVIRTGLEVFATGDLGPRGTGAAFNLSAHTLSDPDTLATIEQALHATGLDPGLLTFEITETAAIADMAVASRFLRQLQELGCKTALDDFGSGMSSFGYLRDLPVDLIKIDGQFIRELATSPLSQALVEAMAKVGQALGMKSVAEWVEDAETLRLLAGYGVDYAQGFYLGRPEIVYWPQGQREGST